MAAESRFTQGLTTPSLSTPKFSFYDSDYATDVGTLAYCLQLPDNPIGLQFDVEVWVLCGSWRSPVFASEGSPHSNSSDRFRLWLLGLSLSGTRPAPTAEFPQQYSCLRQGNKLCCVVVCPCVEPPIPPPRPRRQYNL